jgi:tRNA(adenine34) deaminase
MSTSLPSNAPSRRRFLAGLLAGGLGGAAITWLVQQGGVGTRAPATQPDQGFLVSNTMDHARYMRRAIEQARQVPDLPFGAVIVEGRTGEVLAEGHNRSQENPTFHGEMDVINRLAAEHRVRDWSELVLYTTAEPCPMCQAAIEWAGISQVVYGTSIPFLQQLGWWQIDIRAEEVIRRTSFRTTAILGGVLEEECNQLFRAVPKGLYRDKK